MAANPVSPAAGVPSLAAISAGVLWDELSTRLRAEQVLPFPGQEEAEALAGEWAVEVAAMAALGADRPPPAEEVLWDDVDVAPPDEAALGELVYPEPPPLWPGLTPRCYGTGFGFDAGGEFDALPPGPLLAGLAERDHDAGLGTVSDDVLAGLMIAWRKLTSWATAGELGAVAELNQRRIAAVAAGADQHLAEHASDEIAMVLTLTSRAGAKLVDQATGLAALPATWAALRAGAIDVPRALVIMDEVAGLDAAHAAKVEATVIGRAPRQTTGQLRRSVRAAVIAADPEAFQRRKEEAVKDARVECWTETGGTTALAGRDLPTSEAITADNRVDALARQLKADGAEGTLDQLRAKVFLALLNGQDIGSLLGSQAGNCGEGVHPAAPPPLRGSVHLTMPLPAWLGWSQAPGEVAGYGPIDAAGSRDLANALAATPSTRWCLTVTGTDGRAVAHGCACAGPGVRKGPSGSGPGPPGDIGAWLAKIKLAWLEAGDCTHERESPHYRPPESLAHLIRIRQRTCSAPGCRRPAERCDFEHTIPWHKGGRTCECNGGPCCRRHHRAKQTAGWRLDQPQPGTFIWTTPHGRTYTTEPEPYPA